MALRLAPKLKDRKILDFGCGNGVLFKYLVESGSHVTGCDNKYCELSRLICKNLGVHINIFRELQDIKSEKFDVIFALDVFEHIRDIVFFVDAIKKISHENTVVVISGPTENLYYKLGRFFSGFKGGYHLRNIYQVEDTFGKQGFKRKEKFNLFTGITLFRISSWQIADKSNEKRD